MDDVTYRTPLGRVLALGVVLVTALGTLAAVIVFLAVTDPPADDSALYGRAVDTTTDGTTPEPAPGTGGPTWWPDLVAVYTTDRPAHLAGHPVRSSTVSASELYEEGGAVAILSPLHTGGYDRVEAVALCEVAVAFAGLPPEGLAVTTADGYHVLAESDAKRPGRCNPG